MTTKFVLELEDYSSKLNTYRQDIVFAETSEEVIALRGGPFLPLLIIDSVTLPRLILSGRV